MGKKKVLKKKKEEKEEDESWTTEIKRRRRFSMDEAQLLESIFLTNHCPTQDDIQEIAYRLKVPRKNITTWFQNRRAKNKRKERDHLSDFYPWLTTPALFMQQAHLYHPYMNTSSVKNTCYYYNYTPALYVNPNDLMLNHHQQQISSTSSLNNNSSSSNEYEEVEHDYQLSFVL